MMNVQNLLTNGLMVATGMGGLDTAIGNVVTFLQALAGLTLVIVIIGCGFTAWYYEDGVRRIKEKAISIGIGAACIFGATAIATAIEQMLSFQ